MFKYVVLPLSKLARIGITGHAKAGSTASTPWECSAQIPYILEYMERMRNYHF